MTVQRHRQGRLSHFPLPSARSLTKIVRTVLAAEKSQLKGEVNVIFVDNAHIRRLNKSFLKERSVTDVIAFGYKSVGMILGRHSGESRNPGLKQKVINLDPGFRRGDAGADIFISVPVARSNAARYGETVSRELVRLVVHGLLHVLGYSDHKPKLKKMMWKKQEAFVQRFHPV